jgi:hypothetical protein
MKKFIIQLMILIISLASAAIIANAQDSNSPPLSGNIKRFTVKESPKAVCTDSFRQISAEAEKMTAIANYRQHLGEKVNSKIRLSDSAAVH